jgi:RecB family exonuclease
MDDKERDAYLLEILDRLARLETKFDEQVDVKHTAREALDKSNNNERKLEALEKRVTDHDDKWKTDRTEKWGMWIAIIAGIFTVGASLINVLMS